MTGTTRILAAAHAAFDRRDWARAREGFRAAGNLDADSSFALAEAAWWLGEIDESLTAWEEAYHAYLSAEQPLRAAMAAMYLAVHAMERGDTAFGSGWMSRARRLLAGRPPAAEHGYPLYVDIFAAMSGGDYEAAATTARRVQEIGRRFRDESLVAIGVMGEGRALIKEGHIDEGLALIDESMLAAVSDHLQPVWTGVLYCHLMDVCRELHDIPRASEWTRATQRWCERVPPAVLFRGVCRVHRAQVLRTQGAWDQAEREARQACEDLVHYMLVRSPKGSMN